MVFLKLSFSPIPERSKEFEDIFFLSFCIILDNFSLLDNPLLFFKFGWLVRKASFFLPQYTVWKKILCQNTVKINYLRSSTLIKRGWFKFFIVSLKKRKFCCILLLCEKVGCILVWCFCTKKKKHLEGSPQHCCMYKNKNVPSQYTVDAFQFFLVVYRWFSQLVPNTFKFWCSSSMFQVTTFYPQSTFIDRLTFFFFFLFSFPAHILNLSEKCIE